MPVKPESTNNRHIDHQEETIRRLSERGLPTFMATTILEKLMADQDAILARARIESRTGGS